jgi:hypothetical protein
MCNPNSVVFQMIQSQLNWTLYELASRAHLFRCFTANQGSTANKGSN